MRYSPILYSVADHRGHAAPGRSSMAVPGTPVAADHSRPPRRDHIHPHGNSFSSVVAVSVASRSAKPATTQLWLWSAASGSVVAAAAVAADLVIVAVAVVAVAVPAASRVSRIYDRDGTILRAIADSVDFSKVYFFRKAKLCANEIFFFTEC